MKPSTSLLPLVLTLLSSALSLPGHAQGVPPAQQAAPADSRTPEQVVKSTIEAVMAANRKDPGARAGDPDRAYELVRQHFLPATDFMLATQYAVGAPWAAATPAQREALFKEFQTLLARTYALQLTQAGGQDTGFRFGPPAPRPSGAVDAVVNTTVVSGGEAMPIAYRLRKTSAGWKIYDIDMMGAWMIAVYRRQFAAQLASGGIDGLIRYLAAHNAAP